MSSTSLYRSRADRMLGGVCGGIATHLDLDPTIVRLLAVLLLVIGNAAAVIAYLVMWIAVPEEPISGSVTSNRGDTVAFEDTTRTRAGGPGPDSPPPPPPYAAGVPESRSAAHSVHRPAASGEPHGSRRGRGGAWFGAILVFVGVALLVQIFVPTVRLWDYWPVVIIAAGVLMIVRSKGGDA